MTKKQKLEKLYMRTLRNCNFYLKEEQWNHLHNEIGVLRGIEYAAEELGIPVGYDKDLIDWQNKKNKEDGPAPWEKL